MKRILTRELAFAAGTDAGNRHMRPWNRDAYNAAVRETNRLLLYVPFEDGGFRGLTLTDKMLDDHGLDRATYERSLGGGSAPNSINDQR